MFTRPTLRLLYSLSPVHPREQRWLSDLWLSAAPLQPDSQPVSLPLPRRCGRCWCASL